MPTGDSKTSTDSSGLDAAFGQDLGQHASKLRAGFLNTRDIDLQAFDEIRERGGVGATA
jgi:hypothetical protein